MGPYRKSRLMRRVVTKMGAEQWDATDGFSRPVHMMIEPSTAGSEHLAMGTQEVPPGSRIRVHAHEHTEEVIFVYQGHLRAIVAGEEVELGPETALLIPMGTPHGFVNTSGETVRLTWTYSPAGEQERFRDAEYWKHVAEPETR